jgi:3-oxoacyl-[acyl-carrier protein] reductase
MEMRAGLEGRVAIVTGGSRGIGLAVVRALSREGAHVVVLARGRSADLDLAVATVEGPGEVVAIEADVTSRESVDRAVQRATEWRGALDVVVNNAGPPLTGGPIATVDDAVWANALDVKTLGAVRVSRAALPLLSDDGSGRIINVTGATAKAILPNAAVSAVANAALQAVTGYLATEAASRNVRVNAVCPRMTSTEGWAQRLEDMGAQQSRPADQVRRGFVEGLGIRVGRWASESEVADAVTFLASDRASYITGHVLVVDGSMTKAVA